MKTNWKPDLTVLSDQISTTVKYDPSVILTSEPISVVLNKSFLQFKGTYDPSANYEVGDIVKKGNDTFVKVSSGEWETLYDSNPSFHNVQSHPVRCECCGAVLTSWKCEYCGADYSNK